MKLIQRAMQWLFLRVEAGFNRAFGDQLNPLYHLGALTFYLFWIVAASGLYLYAFFETGVADAYGSVQALTEGQWYVGGIMRSLHRYASDGMVLTMGVHLLRHFAFDRFRSFRWFSWVTGVVLVWLVYASGINGYMLPWDKLAQFVVVGSFEWLDWLPIFDGALIRNFIYQESVNDRFFTLLSFMHLGAPLLVLMLMWVHVQRVPKAQTNPPRPIMIAMLASLLVLSLVAPARSQGGAADFGTAPAALALDWFYLVVFPLFYSWPLWKVWALLCGASTVIAALPWLPPWRRARSGEWRMSVHPGQRSVTVRGGETLLEAGLRAGLAMPYECRNGGCGKCQCTVLHGEVDHGAFQPAALSAQERAQGKALLCCATPRSDVEIEYEATAGGDALPLYQGRVASMQLLGADVMRVMLSVDGGQRLAYQAGQYINIVLEDGARRAFSFANAPNDSGQIELHIRLIPGGRYTTHVFERMRAGDPVQFEGPLGSFVLSESELPIIFVAGATGFAPVKSIVEDAFARGVKRPMLLYWGVRQRADLYMLELAEGWQREHANFRLVPVLSEAGGDAQWSGRNGMVHEAILADFPDLTGYEVYVCGSARMVEAAYPEFLAHGLREEFCLTDAFVSTARAV